MIVLAVALWRRPTIEERDGDLKDRAQASAPLASIRGPVEVAVAMPGQVWVESRVSVGAASDLLVCPALPRGGLRSAAVRRVDVGQAVTAGRAGGRTRGSRAPSTGSAQGQCAGRCSTRRRCGRARRAGTVTIWRRRVAPRATACCGLARVPAARSRLWVIAAQIAHALLAANRPEGRWARGPSIRSAKTVSMIACRRWVMSACGGRLGAVGQERVVAPDREQFVDLGPVTDPAHDQPGGDRVGGGGERGELATSATSASEISSPVSGSRTAPG